MLRLSVLDQSPISAGSSGARALHDTVELARLTDRLGFHRYWVAEHHGTPSLACASPEVLATAIGAATSRIRIGSGGVMLPHYSPVKVAETWSILAALYPDRVDLGLGRAAGTDPKTAFALQRDRRQAAPDDFPSQLVELIGYLDDSLPDDHPFRRLALLPGRPAVPELWLLGSSPQSGLWASELGLPYAFADFINPDGAAIVRRYRDEFVATRGLKEPDAIAAVWVTCAETDEEAKRLSSSARMLFKLLTRGQLIPVPPVDEALAFLEQEPRSFGTTGRRRRNIVGSPPIVREQLEAAAAEYGVDELMVVTMTWDPAARLRSYELIAEEIPQS